MTINDETPATRQVSTPVSRTVEAFARAAADKLGGPVWDFNLADEAPSNPAVALVLPQLLTAPDLTESVRTLSATLRTSCQLGVLVSELKDFDPRIEKKLAAEGLHIHFKGLIPRTATPQYAIALVLPVPLPGSRQPPTNFRVTAVMTVYNEADILATSIRRLNQQGVDVFVVDNWSTDGSVEIAREFLGHGVVEIDRFPRSGATGTYDWGALLGRVEEIAERLRSDWVIHHDVDEFRMSPWRGVSLRTALFWVQQHGFNTVDHTVIVHHPTDDSFVSGADFVREFPYFEFGSRPGHFKQVKAWSAPGTRVDLAGSGGHQVNFVGRRIFPFNFLLRHYPIRSQEHGVRKVFKERRARWNPAERRRGWHTHYESIDVGHKFIRSPESLFLYDEATFHRDYFAERLLRTGLAVDG